MLHLEQTCTRRRRITDPEILERRYPVILREFQLRPGSGGDGAYRGGDGVVREVRHPTTHVATIGVDELAKACKSLQIRDFR